MAAAGGAGTGRPNLIPVLVVTAGAIGTGVLTAAGIAGGSPDFLVAVLFTVLAAAAVDGFRRGRVTGRHGPVYPLAFAVVGAVVAAGMLAVGSTVPGAVLLVVAAGAFVLFLVESRRARTRVDPPAGPPDGR